MKARTVCAAALASGLLLWLASPAVGLSWVGWVALVPVAAASLQAWGTRLGRLAVPLAFVVFLELLLVPALPFGLARDQWGEPPVPLLVGDSPVVAVALVAIPLVGVVLYLVRFPQPLPPGVLRGPFGAPAAVLVPAAVWTALDLLRTKLDPSGFWGLLYASQHDLETARVAALAGPWLLTFALVAVNYSLAAALVSRERLRPALAALAVGAVLVGPVLALGGPEAPRRVTVAAVQPGYDTAEFDLPVNRYLMRRHRDLDRASGDLISDLGPLTREAASRGAALVVWPEATVWVDPRESARVGGALARLAGEAGVTLVVPFFLRAHSHGATLVVRPDGTMSETQPKQRPMWYLGESGENRARAAPVETPVGRVGTLLGVDTQDAASARNLAAAGAELLTSSTHDWAALGEEQRALTRIAAVALGLSLVRADWRYGSAIVGPDGALVADAGLSKRRTVLVGQVPTGAPATPYSGVGDLFGWLCLGIFGLAGAAGALGRERAQAERAPQALTEPELPAHSAP